MELKSYAVRLINYYSEYLENIGVSAKNPQEAVKIYINNLVGYETKMTF